MLSKMLITLVTNGTPGNGSFVNNTTEAKGYMNEYMLYSNVF